MNEMTKCGEIINIDGNTATVKFKRSSACKSCGACISFSSDELIVNVENTLNAKTGDKVVISLHSGSVLKASLIMYVIPLICLICGLFIGSVVFDNQLYIALLAVVFAAISFFLIHLLEPHFEKEKKLQPKMLKFLDEA